MLTLIYTRDEAGNCVVPFVDSTLEIVRAILGQVDRVMAPKWIQEQLRENFADLKTPLEDVDWIAALDADEVVAGFYGADVPLHEAQSFVEIVLPPGELCESGLAEPELDPRRYESESLDAIAGHRIVYWKQLNMTLDVVIDEAQGVESVE